MSTQVAAVNMASIAVGQSGTIDLTQVLSQAPAWKNNPPHLQIFNESGVTVSFTSDAPGIQQIIPAGAWPLYTLSTGINSFKWTALSTIPNAPVSTFYAIYYAPGEQVPPTPQLGNSPISGSTTTSSIQTLSNEGNPANQLVMDVGDSVIADLFTLYTDGHSTWLVDASGTAHQVVKVNRTPNYLQLGQAGDVAEVLGKLNVDQLLTAVLGIAISASGLAVVGGTSTDTLAVTGASTFGDHSDWNMPVAASVAGSVSGTVQLYAISEGTIKFYVAHWSNYQSAGNQQLAFPTPFNDSIIFGWCSLIGTSGGNGGAQLWDGTNTAFSVQQLSSFAASAGNGATTQTNIYQNAIFSSLFISASIAKLNVFGNTAAHSGWMLLIGK